MRVLLLASSLIAASPSEGLGATPEQANEASRLSTTEMFSLADQAIAEKRLVEAEALLTALLADRDADIRNEAAFRLAKLEAAAGRKRDAAVRMRRILDDQPDAQPVRLELAALLAKMGDENAARRELRHARTGNLPPEVIQMVDRFSQTLRSSKPFGGSVQLGISSDSNINRATRSDTLGTVIGDFVLDGDAKERSGHGLSIDSQTFGRLPVGRHQLALTLSQSSDLYRHKRFNDVAAAITAGPELSLDSARLNLSLGVTRRWFGGMRMTNGLLAQAIVTGPLGSSTQGRFGATASKIVNHRNPLESGRTYSAGIEVEKAMTPRMGVGLSLSAARLDLRDPGYSNRSVQAGVVAYQALGRATLIGTISLGRLVADDRIALYPDKRQDWSSKLGLGATFRKVEFMGFSPSVQFRWERNISSIEIYDYRRRSVEFGVARAF